ncbi:hypothetical protein J1G35_18175 [Pseudomonas sp. SH10-3B]|uniref:hypothetical protein n=1 Tax=Pseudomonas sp. SH10-3B TaxID=2816049 RepID=UPI001CA607E9|nr:hypothetical protein [Pseudomonas sp. SH10-3B]MBY8947793.1 hypothetical protein [Pseudomonas sp. SH10-3B]
MKQLLRTMAAVFVFAGILAGCFAVLLLVILIVRFPPLVLVVVVACWIYCKVRMPAPL